MASSAKEGMEQNPFKPLQKKISDFSFVCKGETQVTETQFKQSYFKNGGIYWIILRVDLGSRVSGIAKSRCSNNAVSNLSLSRAIYPLGQIG